MNKVVAHRIAYIPSSTFIGGGNRSLQSLWSNIPTDEFQPVAFVPADGPMYSECRATGVDCEIVDLVQPTLLRPLETIRNQRKWQEILSRHRIDLIHANDAHSARRVMLAARALGIPVLCHVRCELTPEGAKWVFRWMPKPAVFIFNSHAMQNEIGGEFGVSCPQSRQVVIHNGVDMALYPGGVKDSGTGSLRVALVANLLPLKGQAEFLEMARLLVDRGLDVEFWLAGGELPGGDFGKKLKLLSHDLRLENCVRFLGFCNDVPALLKEIDVLVSASHYEAFGRSVAEAMAAGVPVVATDVGGVGEIVADGETGFLVPPHDPGVLADRVELLLRDAELRARLGQAGRVRASQQFSATAHAQKVIDVYRSILSK